MSKFIDKLNRLSRGEVQPLGFVVRQSASKPKIQLVASLVAEGAERLTDHVAGADAVLCRISKPGGGAEALQRVSQALPDVPCGGRIPSGGQEEVTQMSQAGWDFIVFPAANAFATKPENDAIGRILEVEASINEGLLRAANELAVDAVLIAAEKKNEALTWLELMLFRRFADLLTKPLLVSVPSELTGGELKVLWEAGIIGIVVEVEARHAEDRLMKLRQEIDKLEFSSRRSERAGAVVPSISRARGRATTEEDSEGKE